MAVSPTAIWDYESLLKINVTVMTSRVERQECESCIIVKPSYQPKTAYLVRELFYLSHCYFIFLFCIYEQILPDTDFGIYKWNAASNRT